MMVRLLNGTSGETAGLVPVARMMCWASYSCWPRALLTWTRRGSRKLAVPVMTSMPLRESWARITSISVLMTLSARKERSEERRVGKECRSRWWTYQYRKTYLFSSVLGVSSNNHDGEFASLCEVVRLVDVR